jgi:hypothetical protein
MNVRVFALWVRRRFAGLGGVFNISFRAEWMMVQPHEIYDHFLLRVDLPLEIDTSIFQNLLLIYLAVSLLAEHSEKSPIFTTSFQISIGLASRSNEPTVSQITRNSSRLVGIDSSWVGLSSLIKGTHARMLAAISLGIVQT